MGWRSLLVVSILLVATASFVLFWEARPYRTTPAASAARGDTITMSNTYAGGAPAGSPTGPEVNTHEGVSAYNISEGKRLYHWFNCSTCHANGGGDIGPPLMDDKWLYGAAPRNIFASIVEGRPNGMPSFRGKIPDAQVWQLVAYIQSMSGHVPFYAPSSRNDDLQAKQPETMVPKEPTKSVSSPNADSRSTTP